MATAKGNLPHMNTEDLLDTFQGFAGGDPDVMDSEELDQFDAVKHEIRQRMEAPKTPVNDRPAIHQVNVSLTTEDWHTLKGLTDIAQVANPEMTVNDMATGILIVALDAHRSRMPNIVDYGRQLTG